MPVMLTNPALPPWTKNLETWHNVTQYIVAQIYEVVMWCPRCLPQQQHINITKYHSNRTPNTCDVFYCPLTLIIYQEMLNASVSNKDTIILYKTFNIYAVVTMETTATEYHT